MLLTPIAVMLIAPLAWAAEPAAPPAVERYVAVDNVCAWPNLTQLHDGTIIATIFNNPSHGRAEGDVDCWATSDGRFWTKRGTAAPHENSANRMNVAAGRANNGDLLVLSSGWSLKKDDQGRVMALVEVLSPWICRSADGGRIWRVDKRSFPKAPLGQTQYIPFGDILPGADGALRVACYARDGKTKQDGVWMFRSQDDGRTWTMLSLISDANNETAIFHLGAGKWLAAARSLGKTKQRLDLFRSVDDGRTWTADQAVSEGSQHPAHLARLKDGRLLLTYGNRVSGEHGVMAKFSGDEGRTWSESLRLVRLPKTDCGYPSSVQRADGRIVTAYYAGRAEDHNRYHMGVVIWQAPVKK